MAPFAGPSDATVDAPQASEPQPGATGAAYAPEEVEPIAAVGAVSGTAPVRRAVTPHREQPSRAGAPARWVAIIPAYNEDKYISGVVLKTRRYVERVVVVDDGSTDLTGMLAEAAGATVIAQRPNQGKGAAVRAGLLWAQQAGMDAVVLLDGDGQHNPHDVVRLVEPVLNGEADIVVGSRFIGQDARRNIPRWRQAGQRTLNAATAFSSGTGLTDSQSGFRAFSRRAIAILCAELTSTDFTVESEMQFLAREHNLRTLETPVVVDYDVALKRNPIVHGVEVLNGILKLVGQARPLLFVSFPGVIVLALGLLLGLMVVDIYGRTQELAVGYALLTVLLAVVGILALFTGITLHTMRAYFIQFSRRA